MSFHELYVAHSTAVYRYALSLSGNAAEADEITAETFFRAFACEALRPVSARAYLCTIARNLFFDERRRQRRSEVLDEAAEAGFAQAARQDGKAELQEVLAAMAKLPEVYRRPLELWAAGGLNYEEIAMELGVSRPVVKMRIHRARLKLAELLGRPSY